MVGQAHGKTLKARATKRSRKDQYKSDEESDGAKVVSVSEDEHQLEEAVTDGPLGNIMAKILNTSTSSLSTATPVLAKRKAVERQIEEEKLEKRARTLIKQELREKRDAAHRVPSMESANKEKVLRKFATKGGTPQPDQLISCSRSTVQCGTPASSGQGKGGQSPARRQEGTKTGQSSCRQ